MEALALLALVIVGIPFVLPVITWVSARRSRARILALEAAVLQQQSELGVLRARLHGLEAGAAPARSTEPRPGPEAVPAPAPAPSPAPLRAPASERVAPEPPPPSISADELPSPDVPDADDVIPAVEDARVMPERATEPAAEWKPAPAVEVPAFDWESLVGVKLFSAIAGIALVIAAVFFLRYSIDAGWLQPPVRVAIGVIVAIGLLAACELRAARRYPVTANALDAAAIAILFATFFAAHALWNLIPAPVTFGLLALVTALAVLLSIRRESLFIAVLGLLGGFSTPALLSTGENRPLPLFAYLLLLNVGLAWVAARRAWPALTWLSLAFTTTYQWGWVLKFLGASNLPLAMGIFLVFPLAAIGGLALRRGGAADGPPPAESGLERPALVSAVLPLFFAGYLAAVPGYGAHATLLFGFVLMLDVGLLAVAVARRVELLHLAGAAATLATTAIWLATSYEIAGAPRAAVAFTAAFVALYLLAPAVAARFRRPFTADAAPSDYAAPLLLFVFVVLARIEPAYAGPWPLFAPLAGLVVLIAGRAASAGRGGLYFAAAFFAVAAQATWSATHLTLDRLAEAVGLYAAFGGIALLAPMLARRAGRPLEPVWGSGAVLLASLTLMLFLSLGGVAPAALWALGLLVAVLNASLFVESAAGGLPLVSQAGSVVSWLVLMAWWGRAAGSVGIIPSLTVVTGLTLLTLAGHAWTARHARATGPVSAQEFADGTYLGLIGHFFLLLVALNREWSLPPWPLFAALLVMTLAVTAAALVVRSVRLHSAGAVGAAVVIATFGWAAGAPPYGLVSLVAAAAAGAYAVGWSRLAASFGAAARRAAVGAACTVVLVQLTAILAVAGGAKPPFVAVLATHAAAVAVLLALTWTSGWRHVAVLAVVPAWVGVAQWQDRPDLAAVWPQLLVLAGVLYAVFIAYPLILGVRAREHRDPYLAAVAASAMLFFAGRAALRAGGLDWMSGGIPAGEGAVLALLLRQLLHLQPPDARDTGRLAFVAGAALAFVTVAIPVQLDHQWVTIGWALEGAALAWLYRRIPHRGLLLWSVALLATVFVRLALNPGVLTYEPRGDVRIVNWYLYTYLLCAAALILAGWWFSKTDDRVLAGLPRAAHMLPAGGIVLLFLLLNIEIADFYATGPAIVFDFGVTLSQDLTYTIGWLAFGMLLLAAGIYVGSRPARVAAVALIAVTTFKCFLYDLRSLDGLYRVASFVGLALSLALVSLALQKYVLSRPRGTA